MKQISAPPLLRCRGLSFRWSEQSQFIDLPDFEVARGERVFICGPSGSGKSTLLGLIAGVLSPDAGEVQLLGQPLSALRAYQRDRMRADHIGYIFQQFNLISYLDLIDNVLLSCSFSVCRAARASAEYSLRTEAQRLLYTLGLDAEHLARHTVNQLSVGQQQRVAAARALIGAPELIVADEPTSALDAKARDAFVRLLLVECSRHRSGVVFVSHDMTLAKHFDRTIQLNTPIRTEH